MNQTPTYSSNLRNHKTLLVLASIVDWLYKIVLQAFTPLPLFLQPYRHSQTWLNYLWYNAAYHGLYDEELFSRQYVHCCTTKYIFWLGKNKFDRTTAILAGAGHGGWQPQKGKLAVNLGQPKQ
jgi:hypothetical protein